MIKPTTTYKVKNRSTSMVVYKIPETNLRREFQPGEVKNISFDELEKLTYQPGGTELLTNFLQILEDQPADALNIHREYEYGMSEEQVKDLLIKGSLDSFLDALDFAPIGVIDLIKTMSVTLPLTDINKRRALKAKTGFDVDRAIAHVEEERAEAAARNAEDVAPKTRRAATPTEEPTPTGRRVATPEYKIVQPDAE